MATGISANGLGITTFETFDTALPPGSRATRGYPFLRCDAGSSFLVSLWNVQATGGFGSGDAQVGLRNFPFYTFNATKTGHDLLFTIPVGSSGPNTSIASSVEGYFGTLIPSTKIFNYNGGLWLFMQEGDILNTTIYSDSSGTEHLYIGYYKLDVVGF